MPTIELYPIPWGQEPPAHLRQIYEEAFPPEERRPWTQLFGPERCEHIAQLILSDDEVVGFVVGWELPSSHYFEYLVIDPNRRGQGLGTKVLQLLGQLYDDEYPIVLEAEPAGYSPMAERRLAFYARPSTTASHPMEQTSPGSIYTYSLIAHCRKQTSSASSRRSTAKSTVSLQTSNVYPTSKAL